MSDSEAAGSGVEGRGWFLEAGFGPCGVLMTAVPPVFATLEEAVDWVRRTLDRGLPSA